MGQLVQERLGAIEPLVFGGRIAEEICLVVRHAADVLHRARVVLGDEDLVVLGERIHLRELIGVEIEALGGDLEDLGRLLVEVALHGAARVQAERQPAVDDAARDVWAADKRNQVGTEELSFLETSPCPAVVGGAGLGLRSVGDYLPSLRRGDIDRVATP